MLNSEQVFVEQFETFNIKPGTFDHVAHLRLAFLYLSHEGVEGAVQRVGTSIRAYAEHAGAFDKYHQTITEALVRLMAIRLARHRAPDWQTFLADNPDLVNDAKGVLLQHYSAERLFSPEARETWLTPDLMPLEE